MAVQNKGAAVKNINFFNGLTEPELAEIAALCSEHEFGVGELCQVEGQQTDKINLIVKGRVGTVVRIPSVKCSSNEMSLDTLQAGDVFGWSAMLKGSPWSTLKTLEPTEVLTVDAGDLRNLCESNNRIGYIIMRNLSALIASRLRRNRMSILNAIVAIRGDW